MTNFSEKEHVSGAERGSGKSGEREWSGEREAAEWKRSREREMGRSRSAHAPLTCSESD